MRKAFIFCLVISLIINCLYIPASKNNVEASSVYNNPYRDDDGVVTWDCVWFGEYPQSEIIPYSDYPVNTILTLNGSKEISRDGTIVDEELYNSLKNSTDWDSDNTLTIGSQKYYKLTVSNQFNKDLSENEKKWFPRFFKYEPIKWRVLHVEDDTALLFADKVLELGYYGGPRWEHNYWRDTTVRSFLNGKFVNRAFDSKEKNSLVKTLVDGDSNANDYVFLLSPKEISQTDLAYSYGFSKSIMYSMAADPNYEKTFEDRVAVPTNYCSELGCKFEMDYLLRTNGDYGHYIKYVNCSHGTLGYDGDKFSESCEWLDGFRPSLRVNIKSNCIKSAGTISTDGTINEIAYPEGNNGGNSSLNNNNIISVFDENSNPIKDASVTIGDNVYKTDVSGKAEINEKNDTISMVISSSGYNSKHVDNYYITTNEAYSIILSKNTKMDLSKATIYVKGKKEETETDILFKKYSINTVIPSSQLYDDVAAVEEEKTLVVELESEYTGGIKNYQLIQDNKVLGESEDGIIELKNSEFKTGKKVYARLIGNNGKTSGFVELGIRVNQSALVDDTEFEMKLGDTIELTIPSDVPLVGSQKIEIDLDKIPVKVKDLKNWKKKPTDKELKDDIYCLIEDDKVSIEGCHTKNSKLCGAKLKTKVYFDLSGSFSDNIADSTFEKVSGTVRIVISASGGDEANIPGAPIPIIVSYEVKGKMDTKLNAEWNIVKNSFKSNIELGPEFSVDVGAGIGIKYLAKVTVNGEGKIALKVKRDLMSSNDNKFKNIDSYVQLRLHIVAKALWFKYDFNIAKKKWKIYEDSDEARAYPSDIKEYDVFNMDNYSVMDCSTPLNESSWYKGEDSIFSTIDDDNITQTKMLESAYRYSEPQVIEADGYKMMIYQSLNSLYDVSHQQEYLYSIYDNSTSTWSMPKPIQGDGNSDSQIRYYVYNNEIYITWVNIKEGVSDTSTLEEATLKTEVWFGKYDISNDSFECMQVTDNEIMDVMPQIQVDVDGVDVYCVRNAENDYFLNVQQNDIYRITIENNTIESEELVLSAPNIQDYIPYGEGDEASIILMSDGDGDYMTTSDISIYSSFDLATPIDLGTISSMIYDDYSNCIYWSNDGVIKYYNGNINNLISEDSYIGSLFSVVENDSELYIVSSGECNVDDALYSNNVLNVYRYDKSAGVWTGPTKAYYNYDVIDSFAAFFDSNNNLAVMTIETPNDVDVDEESVSSMNYVQISKSIDLQMIATDNIDFVDSDTINMTATIYNNGLLDSSGYTLELKDGNTVVASEHFDESIRAGEYDEIEAEFSLFMDIENKDYTIAVSLDSGQDSNATNNSISIRLGKPDLELVLKEQVNDGDSIANITIINKSNEPINDAKIEVRKGSVDGEVIIEKNIDDTLTDTNYVDNIIINPVDYGIESTESLYFVVSSDSINEDDLDNNSDYLVAYPKEDTPEINDNNETSTDDSTSNTDSPDSASDSSSSSSSKSNNSTPNSNSKQNGKASNTKSSAIVNKLLKTSEGTRYYKKDGSIAKSEWITIGDKKYYFKSDGYAANNEWIKGKWFNSDGTQTYSGTLSWKVNSTGWWVEDSKGWYPRSQWQKIDNIWYYFNPSGYMASNEYYNGYWFNGDGSWDSKYYLNWKCNSTGWWVEDKSGWWPASRWLKVDGKWYYFNASGYMVTNTRIDGYWLGADGACQ